MERDKDGLGGGEMTMVEIPQEYDEERNLGRLKDFQRKSVDAAFRRLYLDSDATDRFLIADEAGLGKTLVARGLIVKAVNHLWNKVNRIDVVYICSNAGIARQNLARLNFTEDKDVAFASRLTMIPTQLGKLQNNKVNFISFTPGTSFNLRSAEGMVEERLILYFLLKQVWRFGSEPKYMNVLQCGVKRDKFRLLVKHYDKAKKRSLLENDTLLEAFKVKLDAGIQARFYDMAERFKGKECFDWKTNHGRNRLVGKLRQLLAESSLEYLEPDIVILDEFQRFKDVMDPESETGKLASQLFRYQDEHAATHAKVVLLSATPFKMYTISEERAGDDHYTDFIRTLSFLHDNDSEKTGEAKRLLAEYRDALFRVKSINDTEELTAAKDGLQLSLRRVMTRTERYGATSNGNELIADKLHTERARAEDIHQYAELADIARRVGADKPLEYWKSAPYMLNFMDDYKLKRKFSNALASKENPIKLKPADSLDLFLKDGAIKSWQPIEFPNAKLRVLLDEALEKHQTDQHLWIPPSLPYWRPSGRYANTADGPYTKTLVFSSWKMVPKAISMLASYEVERRMSSGAEERYNELGPRALLRFNLKEGLPQNMASLALLFPALSLALAFDPCEYFAKHSNVTLEEMLAAARSEIDRLILRLRPTSEKSIIGGNPLDRLWAYLARLDAVAGYAEMASAGGEWPGLRWLKMKGEEGWHSGQDISEDDSEKGFLAHVEEFRNEYVRYEQGLPAPDERTLDALALICIGSPAVTTLRALLRQVPAPSPEDLQQALAAAASIAQGFRSMFNRRWNLRFLQGREAFWESALNYCCEGNLQAVMDEYIHLFTDLEGLFDLPAKDKLQSLANVVCSVLYLRAANPKFDVIGRSLSGKLIPSGSMSIRTHFALRFGDEKEVTELLDGNRTDVLRAAFNSPFRPFVFATTSIGQEGLDFHGYCHSIFHWNLPANPVDLEQREGRINRYKGHLIRKNLVRDLPVQEVLSDAQAGSDPWALLFQAASNKRAPDQNELVPFWVYECAGGDCIERHLPLLPFSRERLQFEALKRSLMFYRMAFGQPRQQDLVDYLKTTLVGEEPEAIEAFVKEFMIDLSPE